MAVDLAAWGILETLDAERAENEARAMKDLPPLPSKFGRKGKPTSDTVQIKVGSERRTVPLPPPGCFYDSSGKLVTPERDAMRRF